MKTNTQLKALGAFCVAALLTCTGLASAAHAGPQRSIVGLWSVINVSNAGGPTIPSYVQWHSDGLEIEIAGLFLGAVCQGTFKQTGDGVVHLYHVAYTFDTAGALNGNFVTRATDKVSANGKTYSGTYTKDFYDLNGNFLFEDTGTQTATLLTTAD